MSSQQETPQQLIARVNQRLADRIASGLVEIRDGIPVSLDNVRFDTNFWTEPRVRVSYKKEVVSKSTRTPLYLLRTRKHKSTTYTGKAFSYRICKHCGDTFEWPDCKDKRRDLCLHCAQVNRGQRSGHARRKGTPLEKDRKPWVKLGISRSSWYAKGLHRK